MSRSNSFRSSIERLLAPFVLTAAAFAASSASAQSTAVATLAPAGTPVEVVDNSERISGNAATGLVLVQPSDTIGHDRLWAYLSEPLAPKLKLRISSIDGRYYAEVDYDTGKLKPGWVALDLSLREFSFLEHNYKDPLSEIAALLSDGDQTQLYPVRWGAPHGAAGASPPPPKDTDPIRVYMNTERATAFVVVGGNPTYCRDASAMSGFKFNAICDMSLGDVRDAKPGEAEPPNGSHVVSAIEVFRRSGVRTLAPVTLDVLIKY